MGALGVGRDDSRAVDLCIIDSWDRGRRLTRGRTVRRKHCFCSVFTIKSPHRPPPRPRRCAASSSRVAAYPLPIAPTRLITSIRGMSIDRTPSTDSLTVLSTALPSICARWTQESCEQPRYEINLPACCARAQSTHQRHALGAVACARTICASLLQNGTMHAMTFSACCTGFE